MKILPVLLCLFTLGCESTPESPEARAARLESERRQQTEREQANAQESLRNRYKRYTTEEMQVMYRRYVDLAGHNTTRDTGLAPAANAIFGSSDRRNAEKLIDIERELLRRWKLGDAQAKLPHFAQ